MNAQLLNPFTIDIPDSVSSTLETAECTVCRFNDGYGVFHGQYLAVGRSDGWITIWDIETRSVLRLLPGHVRAVSDLAWSSYNRYLASCSGDWNVIIWDLGAKSTAGPVTSRPSQHHRAELAEVGANDASGSGSAGETGLPFCSERKRTIRFDAPVLSVQFAPGNSKKLLIVLVTQQAYLVDIDRRVRVRRQRETTATTDLGIQVEDLADPPRLTLLQPPTADNNDDEEAHASTSSITAARFTPDARYVVAGTSKGSLLVFDAQTGDYLDEKKVLSANSGVKELAFDASGRFLVVNCNDRAVRMLSVTTSATEADDVEARGSKRRKTSLELTLLHKIQDMIQRSAWNNLGFSPNSDYIYAGAAHRASHNVYIWDRSSGVLVKILEGPKDWLVGVDWHPDRPMLASVSNMGIIYLWFTPTEEIWSAYAPGFEELEENVEYEEHEDEFDFIDDQDNKDRRKQEEEEAAFVRVGAELGGVGVRILVERQTSRVQWPTVENSLGLSAKDSQNGHYKALKMLLRDFREVVSESAADAACSELVFTLLDDDTSENFIIPPRLEEDYSDLQDDHP